MPMRLPRSRRSNAYSKQQQAEHDREQPDHQNRLSIGCDAVLIPQRHRR
jgi:hypothetical protein